MEKQQIRSAFIRFMKFCRAIRLSRNDAIYCSTEGSSFALHSDIHIRAFKSFSCLFT